MKQTWHDQAVQVVCGLRGNSSGSIVTGGDIRTWAEGYVGKHAHHNAWGSVIRKAARNGVLQPTGQFIPAKRPEAKGRMTQLWKVAA